ncbi:glycosyltransferase [Paractinoplanes lichenicola]|uniref:Glycosyltransferase n=1 Tax=Paractinoplanes lichenicola TaxID=2802976 RepID=A0ABS1VFG8_9ACTN|nr:nucleotide disphospho-sugar-binding domain-containing protein [Actinoplanes lichenicola]MBL7253413.1 hypothetical protein [Actinoplanes lichenicola]
MRALFSAGSGTSSLLRMVLLARALHTAGHEVRVCCPARLRDRVTRAGLVPGPADPWQFSQAWGPDLVVHDPLSPGSTALAAASGVPTIGYLPYDRPPLLPRPTVWIDPCPPPLRDEPEPDAWRVRCDAYEAPGRFADEPSFGPRVCITGMPTGGRPEDEPRARLFRRVAEGVESLGLELVVLSGDDHPWSRALSGSVVVVHGGDEGVVYAAARSGVSQLVLPAGEPERRAGERLERAGIGRCLTADELGDDPSMLRLRFYIAELVNGGRMLPAAVQLGRSIAGLPGPADLVPAITTLTR